MADAKLSALTELTTPASGDLLYIVDISEPSENDQSKKLVLSTLDARYLLGSNNLSDLDDVPTARVNLELEVGVDVQAYDAELAAIAALAITDGNFIVGNGSTWVAENGATARTSLGLGSMAIIDDAPSNGSQYARQDAAWAVVSGGVTSVFTRTGAVVATAGDYTASLITNVAAGNIAAVTVQAAIDELDTEKAGLALANVFTAVQKINVNSAVALLVEQDGIKDNVLVVDTTNGRIGAGTPTPQTALSFPAASEGIALYNTADEATNFSRVHMYWVANEFRIITDKGGSGPSRGLVLGSEVAATTRFFVSAAEQMRITSGAIGMFAQAPAASLHIDQTSTTAAKPVLLLDQADVSEEFIHFIGTSTTNASQSLVDAADMTTPGSIVGWLKIYVQDDQATNPITDGFYYVPFYSAPTA